MGRHTTAQVGVASACEARRPGEVKMPRESYRDGIKASSKIAMPWMLLSSVSKWFYAMVPS